MKKISNKIKAYFEGKLFAKLGAQLIVVILLLLSSLFYYQAYQSVMVDNKAKSVTATLTSKAILDKIDRNFYERFGDVQAFAVNKLVVDRLQGDTAHLADLQTFVNTMVQYYVLYDLMLVCDLQGNVVLSNTIDKSNTPIVTQNLIGKNYANEEWFRVCSSTTGPAGGAWYSDFMVNDAVKTIYTSDGYGMAFAAPIKDTTGKVIGVWYNFASWKEVTQAIRILAENELRQTYAEAKILMTRNEGEIIDANDSKIINAGIKVDSVQVKNEGFSIKISGHHVNFADWISGWSTASGAYIYKGKNWHAVTLIPKTKLSFMQFFGEDMLPVILITLIVVFGIGMFFYKIIAKAVIDKVIYLKGVLLEFSNGNLPQIDASMQSQDEIGEIASAVKNVSENLNKLVTVLSTNVNSVDKEKEIVVFNNQGVLGSALVGMRENLRKVAEEDQKRIWATEGMAKFGEILRNNTNGIAVLTDNILVNLVKYLGVNQGGLFVVNDTNQHNKYLELIACYAWDKKKYINTRIEEGQGLVGQAWQESDVIYLTEVPQDFVKITSGLGDANPTNILIVPLTMNDETFGVIELASLSSIEPFQIDFLKKLAESIASTLASAKTNERTKYLLTQSQQQTEEMRAQEEEMRQNMEEMQATAEESERKSMNYENAIQRLNDEIYELNQEINKLKS